VDRLLADRWYPPTKESVARTAPDEAALMSALGSSTSRLRAFAVRQLGRFEDVGRAPLIKKFLSDKSEEVRLEAIQALPHALRYSTIDATEARMLLEGTCPGDEALGHLHYSAGGADEIERKVYVEKIDPDPLKKKPDCAESAIAGLEHLIRLHPGRVILDRTRKGLLSLARGGPAHWFDESPGLGPSPAALRILGILHVADIEAAEIAIRFRCPTAPADLFCGWEIRQSGVKLIDPRDDSDRAYRALELAGADVVTPVRIEVLRKRASIVTESKHCGFLLDALKDIALIVRQEAVDLMTPICEEREALTERLKAMAVDYGDAQRPLERVPLAGHALIALARFSPDDARATIQKITPDVENWNGLIQMRRAAAIAAGVLKDEAIALRFVADDDPNVCAEALKSLKLLRSESLNSRALIALDSDDYQLIRTAAAILRNAPNRDVVLPALLTTLTHVTEEGADTSRDVRLEIFETLKSIWLAEPTGTNPLLVEIKTLEGYLKDYDPAVASAAADVLGMMNNGKRPAPQPTWRAPEQDAVRGVRGAAPPDLTKAHIAILTLADPGDTLEVSFFTRDAPLSVTRFIRLAGEGYYNSQTVYRSVPMSFLAGGSPHANEFSGDKRFLRDEIGSREHDLAMIGMLTHGRDTGNAQFFIDLGRLREWDDDYTVMGQVMKCYKGFILTEPVNFLNELLEGTKITSIEIK